MIGGSKFNLGPGDHHVTLNMKKGSNPTYTMSGQHNNGKEYKCPGGGTIKNIGTGGNENTTLQFAINAPTICNTFYPDECL